MAPTASGSQTMFWRVPAAYSFAVADAVPLPRHPSSTAGGRLPMGRGDTQGPPPPHPPRPTDLIPRREGRLLASNRHPEERGARPARRRAPGWSPRWSPPPRATAALGGGDQRGRNAPGQRVGGGKVTPGWPTVKRTQRSALRIGFEYHRPSLVEAHTERLGGVKSLGSRRRGEAHRQGGTQGACPGGSGSSRRR